MERAIGIEYIADARLVASRWQVTCNGREICFRQRQKRALNPKELLAFTLKFAGCDKLPLIRGQPATKTTVICNDN
jgi:hypothetical protein